MTLVEAIKKLNPSISALKNQVAYDNNGQVINYDLAAAQNLVDINIYKEQRRSEYPPITDYLDGVVKGDQAQIDAYIAACQAVKAKYPKV